MPFSVVRWFVLFFASAALACSCGTQKVNNYCLEADDHCAPCAADSDCQIMSNGCSDFADCAHKDTVILAPDYQCALEKEPPSPDRCRCIDSICREPKE